MPFTMQSSSTFLVACTSNCVWVMSLYHCLEVAILLAVSLDTLSVPPITLNHLLNHRICTAAAGAESYRGTLMYMYVFAFKVWLYGLTATRRSTIETTNCLPQFESSTQRAIVVNSVTKPYLHFSNDII